MSKPAKNSPAKDLETTLFDEKTIRHRVREIANEINTAYQGRELTVIAVANGAIVFTADLIRELTIPLRLDCIRASSYQDRTTSTTIPRIVNALKLDIEDADVLLIDDILDTGNTLLHVSKTLQAMKPASLKTCVLLDKQMRRTVDIEADFVGFAVPDEFVVGYGLDFAERYRQLPYIGMLRKEIYS